ncbi:hypothetical protein [Cochlodiniinecator piscidefendens]|uniref:hypothetical protein n=1 Tax=Cochlodiniinecator piscidefendens TaxID=2715756 RepID=UPI00140D168B|nr:hypothetical protein [Cochlodiniinecator piscidefendens]
MTMIEPDFTTMKTGASQKFAALTDVLQQGAQRIKSIDTDGFVSVVALSGDREMLLSRFAQICPADRSFAVNSPYDVQLSETLDLAWDGDIVVFLVGESFEEGSREHRTLFELAERCAPAQPIILDCSASCDSAGKRLH